MESAEQWPKVGVGVLIFSEGQILLGKRKGTLGNGEYGSLGGHVDPQESLEDAVRRETMEESGLTLKNIKYLGTINLRKYAPKH